MRGEKVNCNTCDSSYDPANLNEHGRSDFCTSKQISNCNVCRTNGKDFEKKNTTRKRNNNTNKSQTPISFFFCDTCEIYLKSINTAYHSTIAHLQKVANEHRLQNDLLSAKFQKKYPKKEPLQLFQHRLSNTYNIIKFWLIYYIF